jgi:protein-disulfide isomerase
MGGSGVKRVWRAISACALVSTAAVLAACSGGVSSLTLPSFSGGAATEAQAAEAEKPAEKPVDMAELAKPGPLGDHYLGKANAPVTVVEYASLTCPHCAKFQADTFPKFKKAYIDTGKVRYVFREFPIGKSAAAAAIAVRCAPDKAYFKLNDKLFASQAQWVAQEVKSDEIYKIVQSAGLKRDKFDACFANQSINDALYEVKARGRGLGVSGTPTFFVNGKRAGGELTFDEMSKLVEAALHPAQPQTQQPQGQQPQAQQPQQAPAKPKAA